MPTEAALKVLGEKMGEPEGKNGLSEDPSETLGCCRWWSNAAKRIATLEFDSMRKSMGIIALSKSGSKTLLVKGAVETLLERSSHIQLQDGSVVPLDEKSRKLFWRVSMNCQQKLCIALDLHTRRNLGILQHMMVNTILLTSFCWDPANYAAIETDLIFAGLAGLSVGLCSSYMICFISTLLLLSLLLFVAAPYGCTIAAVSELLFVTTYRCCL